MSLCHSWAVSPGEVPVVAGFLWPVPKFNGFPKLQSSAVWHRCDLKRSVAVSAATNRFFARRSEEQTPELQPLMRISYAAFCLQKKNGENKTKNKNTTRAHSRQA